MELERTDPLALARPLTLAFGAILAVTATALTGIDGGASALLGAGISLANVWGLQRLGQRAVRQALAGSPGAATGGLTAALGAKTVLLFVAVALVSGMLPIKVTPFGLGLLTGVAALVGAGLIAGRRAG